MGTEVSSKKELVVQIGDKLKGLIVEQAGAFPKDFNETRFLQNCIAVLQDTPNIEKCKPMSVVRTLIKGAYLGLDFFRKECYAIPYGDVCNFQLDYKGGVKLAKKYGKNVQDVYAKIVREGDSLEVGVKDGRQVIDFKPVAFNDNPVTGVFAVVTFTDGTSRYEAMSVKEVEDIRKHYSKAPNSSAWTKSWGEMAKAKVLHRISKVIDLDFDSHEQQAAYDDGQDSEFKKPEQEKKTVSDPFKNAQDAEVVQAEESRQEEEFKSVDPILFAEFKKKHKDENDEQIEIRVREVMEANK